MSEIRCIYSVQPKFPATDQHPSAVRYQIGALWVDAIGGKPTQAEIDAVLNPPVVPDPADRLAAIEAALIAKGTITKADVDTAVAAEAKG